MGIRLIDENEPATLDNLEDDSYMECCGEIFLSVLDGVDCKCPHCGCEGPPVQVAELIRRYKGVG
jgi:hypothetical protein